MRFYVLYFIAFACLLGERTSTASWRGVTLALAAQGAWLMVHGSLILLIIIAVFPSILLIYDFVMLFKWPSYVDVARRMEQDSNIKHRPISTLKDSPAGGDLLMWEKSLIQRKSAIPDVKICTPRNVLIGTDKNATRAAALIIFISGLLVFFISNYKEAAKNTVTVNEISKPQESKNIALTKSAEKVKSGGAKDNKEQEAKNAEASKPKKTAQSQANNKNGKAQKEKASGKATKDSGKSKSTGTKASEKGKPNKKKRGDKGKPDPSKKGLEPQKAAHAPLRRYGNNKDAPKIGSPIYDPLGRKIKFESKSDKLIDDGIPENEKRRRIQEISNQLNHAINDDDIDGFAKDYYDAILDKN